MYINTQTMQLQTESEIRAANPNTSFPVPFVPPTEYAYVFPAPQHAHDPVTQRVQAATPELTNLGHWEQRWEVVSSFVEYTDSEDVLHTVAEQEAAAIAADIEAKRVAAIPASVSPRQIRQALTRAGLRASVEAAVAAGDQDTKDWYEFATEFRRDSPVVADLGLALGVSDLQLDDLWTLAGTL